MTVEDTGLKYSLLDEPLITHRRVGDGAAQRSTLPGLFVALVADTVRDFPALRPHQRHPWHAFLVQLAAIALHAAGRGEPWGTEAEWRAALLALTPQDPDGAAWCLVTPASRPAFLQAPEPTGTVSNWRTQLYAADELDMLVTSKNHDVKSMRAHSAGLQDWLFALLSLQTQEGYGGKFQYGISRMAGAFGSRAAIGAVPPGNLGARWRRDVERLLLARSEVCDKYALRLQNGKTLLWITPWDGDSSESLEALDPFYIEICRRVRLQDGARLGRNGLWALTETSRVKRLSDGERNGVTGDLWTAVDILQQPYGEALKIRASGFNYQLCASLLYGIEYRDRSFATPLALKLVPGKDAVVSEALFQGISRGGPKGNKSVTEGYHERRIPITPKVRSLLLRGQTAPLAQAAKEHISCIRGLRGVLWSALALLFNNGVQKKEYKDDVKKKATAFCEPFEQLEDARFFFDLHTEFEASDVSAEQLRWQSELAERARKVLENAFNAGPRSGTQRYRARSAAMNIFRAGIYGEYTPVPRLADHYRAQAAQRQEEKALGTR
jgi:CRISPR system Cascade subunit CasA